MIEDLTTPGEKGFFFGGERAMLGSAEDNEIENSATSTYTQRQQTVGVTHSAEPDRSGQGGDV